MNTTRWVLLMCLLLTMALLPSASRRETPAAAWQATPIKIDGLADDWVVPPRYYSKATKLSYDITNDDKNIYIIIKAVDEDLQKEILMTGFNIWLDTTGKKKEVLGIKYPLPPNERLVPPPRQQGIPGMRVDMKAMKRSFVRNVQEMEVIGLVNGKSARTNPQNTFGIKVAMNIDDNDMLVYEVAIPIQSVFKDKSLADASMTKINFGFRTNKVETPRNPDEGVMPPTNSITAPPGGMGGGGMNGMGGGGMGRGGGMSHAGGMPMMDKQVDLWQTLVLAKEAPKP